MTAPLVIPAGMLGQSGTAGELPGGGAGVATVDEVPLPVPTPTVVPTVQAAGDAARVAARRLAVATSAQKNRALQAMADAVAAQSPRILDANSRDLERARVKGLPDSLVDRIRLDQGRLDGIADALRDLVALPDPVGHVVRGSTLPNGLQIRQVRVPFGVIGMIYEARPNVTVDAAGIAMKSGNAVILRGGSAASYSNRALVATLREAIERAGLPADAVHLLEGGHDEAVSLMRARGLVDVIVPRGGAKLIETVVTQSTVPVIETGSGNVHVYVDAAAELGKALEIVVNAKTQRPSVCNAAETLLVHADIAARFLPLVLPALHEQSVKIHGDVATITAAAGVGVPVLEAGELDWACEYHGLEIAVRVVADLDEAMAHVARYSTGHTEAIVTEDRTAARRWTSEVDAAVVMVNSSTRFTDGGEFGFGAEIGISTQKLHARGPMGLPEMTSTKWIVEGDGHIRS
ncbi:glutamate-5-semialdehyde dehydrogenase [Austwickia sp. TVS 96-490-7B]|uniref:glutamate-5-semialdehyde dehydrogenase n=1 Tax=Austwickia sp. TVS 96-490-7B TaxID=2830843 RepID=UPI002105BCF4|nr:glutamate-5-semialdehyde dehydrogenase [Austwickia sp. TVS 96-490-7B]